VLLGGLVLSAATAADPNMAEGNWEVTTKMEIAGMPMMMPPQTRNQCLTKKNMVPEAPSPDPDQKCSVQDQKVSGDTVSWRIQCKGKQGTMDGEGQIKYSGRTYDGTMRAKMTEPGGGEAMVMKMTFQGRHTGACKAEAGKPKKPGDY
jgi:hypothetical protein